jgi:hypothetical protein
MRLPAPARILGACALGAALSVAAAGGPAVGHGMSVAGPRLKAPQAENLPASVGSYAYLGAGMWSIGTLPRTVWVSDAQLGEELRVTGGVAVSTFAVSSRRMILALADGKRRVRVYSLRPPYRKLPWHGPQPLPRFHPLLLPTCGTIAAWTRTGIVDGLTGREISIDGYWRPACSADRKVAAGASEAALRRLLAGGPFPAPGLYLGKRPLGPADVYYAVSPHGRYVAWVAFGSVNVPSWPVCVVRAGGSTPPSCTPSAGLGWAAYWRASLDSVADDGAVIFAAQNGPYGCPGCRSIYYWTPAAAATLPVLMEPSGADPQWITPAAARALVARYKYLRSHKKQPARERPQGGKKARLPAA